MSNTNSNQTFTYTILFMAIVMLIVGLMGFSSYEAKLTAATVKNADLNNVLKYKNQETERLENAVKKLAESQIHQYTMIDDRYLIRISIFELKTINGPMWAYDRTIGQHVLVKVNKNSVFRQPYWKEIVRKFESDEYN